MTVDLDLLDPGELRELKAELDAEKERRQRGEELRQEAGRLAGSLRGFIADAWRILEPATVFVPNWHIDAIADHLEACTRREIRRLIINVPPRHMKSLNVGVFWPAWWWTSQPHLRFLTGSYGEALAVRDAVKTRRLITSAWYLARWGDVFRLTSDQNTKSRYENDRTGYRIATSVGGGATGEGGDVIVIDDPHKTDEIESDTEREAVLDWHDGTISTRFNDPKTGVEVVVMQRLHENDLTGHLLAQGGFDHLCLPAEYEPRHPFVWPDDPRTRDGQLLWPDHFGTVELDELKVRLGSYKAAGQLQQRPAPAEGGILKTAWWRYFPSAYLEPPSPLVFSAIVQSWDTSWKEKTTSDYVVGTVWGVTGANRYLLRRFRDRVGLPGATRAIRELYAWVEQTYPRLPHTILVENTANGPEIVAALRREIPGLLLTNVKGDKVQRAHAVSPQLEAGNVFVPGSALADGTGPDAGLTPAWVVEFLAEHSSFPNAAHDDQVDTTTQALIWLRARSADRAPPPPETNGHRQAVTAGIADEVY